MKSVTKEYLVEIICRKLNVDIDIHRMSKRQLFSYEPCSMPTDEDLLDFIISTPWFDDNLKDFLIGNLAENTIIISQAWENEFIVKTVTWATSKEWLHGIDHFLKGANLVPVKKEHNYLSLPY